MAAAEKNQLWLHQEASAIKESSQTPRKRLIRQKTLAWFGEKGEKEGRERREGGKESPEAQQHFEKSISLRSAAFTTADLF